MKKKIITAAVCALSAVLLSIGAYAADFAQGYIDDGYLYVTASSDSRAVVAYYESEKLVSAQVAVMSENGLRAPIPVKYTKIRVWFINSKQIKTLHIIDRTAFTPAPAAEPIATATPAATKAPVVTTEPDEEDFAEEEYAEVQTSCVFSISFENAFNSEALDDDIRSALPPDGFFVTEGAYTVDAGMTIYDLVMRAAQRYDLEIDGSESYISSICGFGEFDCGPLSGWMYTVNGESVRIPINTYEIQDGDEIRVVYTCNLGKDI